MVVKADQLALMEKNDGELPILISESGILHELYPLSQLPDILEEMLSVYESDSEQFFRSQSSDGSYTVEQRNTPYTEAIVGKEVDTPMIYPAIVPYTGIGVHESETGELFFYLDLPGWHRGGAYQIAGEGGEPFVPNPGVNDTLSQAMKMNYRAEDYRLGHHKAGIYTARYSTEMVEDAHGNQTIAQHREFSANNQLVLKSYAHSRSVTPTEAGVVIRDTYTTLEEDKEGAFPFIAKNHDYLCAGDLGNVAEVQIVFTDSDGDIIPTAVRYTWQDIVSSKGEISISLAKAGLASVKGPICANVIRGDGSGVQIRFNKFVGDDLTLFSSRFDEASLERDIVKDEEINFARFSRTREVLLELQNRGLLNISPERLKQFSDLFPRLFRQSWGDEEFLGKRQRLANLCIEIGHHLDVTRDITNFKKAVDLNSVGSIETERVLSEFTAEFGLNLRG